MYLSVKKDAALDQIFSIPKKPIEGYIRSFNRHVQKFNLIIVTQNNTHTGLEIRCKGCLRRRKGDKRWNGKREGNIIHSNVPGRLVVQLGLPGPQRNENAKMDLHSWRDPL